MSILLPIACKHRGPTNEVLALSLFGSKFKITKDRNGWSYSDPRFAIQGL